MGEMDDSVLDQGLSAIFTGPVWDVTTAEVKKSFNFKYMSFYNESKNDQRTGGKR